MLFMNLKRHDATIIYTDGRRPVFAMLPVHGSKLYSFKIWVLWREVRDNHKPSTIAPRPYKLRSLNAQCKTLILNGHHSIRWLCNYAFCTKNIRLFAIPVVFLLSHYLLTFKFVSNKNMKKTGKRIIASAEIRTHDIF